MPVLLLVVVVIAVLSALVVLAMARAQGAGDRSEGPLRAFRRGISARRHPDAEQRAQARAAEAEPVDVTLAEMLRGAVESGEGYLQPAEIVGAWASPRPAAR